MATPLRERTFEDLQLCGLDERTQIAYVREVHHLPIRDSSNKAN